jgi:hypothetical protein
MLAIMGGSFRTEASLLSEMVISCFVAKSLTTRLLPSCEADTKVPATDLNVPE